MGLFVFADHYAFGFDPLGNYWQEQAARLCRCAGRPHIAYSAGLGGSHRLELEELSSLSNPNLQVAAETANDFAPVSSFGILHRFHFHQMRIQQCLLASLGLNSYRDLLSKFDYLSPDFEYSFKAWHLVHYLCWHSDSTITDPDRVWSLRHALHRWVGSLPVYPLSTDQFCQYCPLDPCASLQKDACAIAGNCRKNCWDHR